HSVAQRLHVDRAQGQNGVVGDSAGDFDASQVGHRRLYIAPLELTIDDLEDVLAPGILTHRFARDGECVLATNLDDGHAHVVVGQQFQILVVEDAGDFAHHARPVQHNVGGQVFDGSFP